MRRAYLLFLLISAAIPGTVQALEVEKFFMPGKLISDHAEFESDCKTCHVRMRDTTQNRLCLDCHDHQPIAEDIRNRRGFHGKDRDASGLACKACHSDHLGRDARIVWLDPDKFDHGNTDFRLEGRHMLTECKACHVEDRKYREASQGCFDCHEEDDAHDGKLGEKCDSCHNAAGWNRSEFDHDKTEFKLRDSHRQVACVACHINEKYKDTPKQCVSCHAIRDVHARRLGKKCQQCHREKSWDQTSFEHDRHTRFRLEGKHRDQACNACHAPDYRISKDYKPRQRGRKARNCYACHRRDDVHNESNGKECDSCHVPKGWKFSVFDHDRKTDFPLRGGHENLVCEACHIAGAESREIDTDCHSCHKLDDVHRGEQGRNCEQCHNDIAWQHEVRFDHDLSGFPLIGQHAVTGCEVCHLDAVYGDTDGACVDCHRNDDVHKRGLGRECARCHNANAWLIWEFDHDGTDFSLRGAHEKIHCHVCHAEPLDTARGDDWRCTDCHRKDDVHEGNFGTSCDDCHDQERFDRINLKALRDFARRVNSQAEE
jgi:hypothetical protein